MQLPDPGPAELLVPIGAMLTGGLLIVVVGQTIRHWVDRHFRHKELGGSDVSEALGRLETCLTTVADLAGRIQEIEERLDFAERVLAKADDRSILPPRQGE